MSFNETYDLVDFNSFADFIANAKTVLEGEGVEFLFKSDKEFTDRDAMGYHLSFNNGAGSMRSSILEVTQNIHFADDEKPRIALQPRAQANTNVLRWQGGTWRLLLDFEIKGASIPENISLTGTQTENTTYSNGLISSTGGYNRLVLNIAGYDLDYTQWESLDCTISSLPIVEKGKNASDYIDDNDTSVIYDSSEIPADYSNPPNMYYMYSRLYSVNSDYADKQQEYDRKVEFRVPDGIRMCYYRDNESRNNVMLSIEPCEFKVREFINNSWSVWQTVTDLSIYAAHYFADIESNNYIEFNNRYYYSSINTNIPLAKNEDDAALYLEHKINDDEMYIQQK